MKNSPMFRKLGEEIWNPFPYGHCNSIWKREGNETTFDGQWYWEGGLVGNFLDPKLIDTVTCREYAACPEKSYGRYEIKDSRISKSCEPFPGLDSGTYGCKRKCYCLNLDHSKTMTITR